jgi:hypothetical protein
VRLPRPARIDYQAVITQNGRLTALPSTIDWRSDGQSYDLRWTLDSPVISDRGRSSTGRVTANGLAPAITDALPPDAQDPLSVWIELGALIAANPAQYLIGSRISVTVMDGKDATPWQMDFSIVDDADIMGAGQFEDQLILALCLVHEPVDNQDARIELWLGKSFDYLPIRLMMVRPGGVRLEMVMRGVSGLPEPDIPKG